jgi:hypothetical protein
VKTSLLHGLAQVRTSKDTKKLRAQVARTLSELRSERGSTGAGRRGRRVAIQGFAWLQKGIDSQLAFTANDSGNVEAATRDAKNADRYLTRAAKLLRTAGRVFGAHVGELEGH